MTTQSHEAHEQDHRPAAQQVVSEESEHLPVTADPRLYPHLLKTQGKRTYWPPRMNATDEREVIAALNVGRQRLSRAVTTS